MPVSRSVASVVFLIGCAPDAILAPTAPPRLTAIEPAAGSVAGGERVTLRGAQLSVDATVTIGSAPCTDVVVEVPDRLTCTTGATDFVEGAMDIVVETRLGKATLPAGFDYSCPWTTSSGRRSCGAAPPRPLPAPAIAARLIADRWRRTEPARWRGSTARSRGPTRAVTRSRSSSRSPACRG